MSYVMDMMVRRYTGRIVIDLFLSYLVRGSDSLCIRCFDADLAPVAVVLHEAFRYS